LGGAPGKSAYSILKSIEDKYDIRQSTLKLNARVLRRLGLIDFGKGMNAKITGSGKVVLSAIKCKMEAEYGK